MHPDPDEEFINDLKEVEATVNGNVVPLSSAFSLSEDDVRIKNTLLNLPIHEFPERKTLPSNDRKSERDKPRRVENKPTPKDIEYHASIADTKQAFINTDPLVKLIDSSADPTLSLQRIKLEMAREIASLHFQRLELEKYGKDIGAISSRRLEALDRLAKFELRVKESSQGIINLGSERMQRVLSLWVDMMREIAQEVLPPEFMDLFINRFATAMEGWEEKAQSVLED